MSEEISVMDLKKMIDNKDDFKLIDVREPEELNICKIDSAKLIPMGDMEKESKKLDKDKEYIIMCRSGNRSMQVVHLLKTKGFKNVRNLTGGILDWIDEVDSSLQRY